MNCPNCGSNLVNKGKFCPYCGTAIPEDITIRINSRQEVVDHARITEAQENGKARITNAKEKTKRRFGCVTVIVVIIVAFVTLAIYADYSDKKARRDYWSTHSSTTSSTSDYLTESRTQHYAEVERLQKIEDEILDDIRNERYGQALLKAQTLYYTGTYSNETKKSWNEKREALIKELSALIEQK